MKQLKLIPGCYDDMESLLAQFSGVHLTVISMLDLNDSSTYQNTDVIFFCCGNEDDLSEQGSRYLIDFIQGGGAIYASDWAGAIIDQIAPNFVQFAMDGEQMNQVTCRVIESGLQAIIGETINIHFDMSAWWRITNIQSSQVKVYIVDQEGLPIVISIPFGKGFIIYTSFHNESQMSELELTLIKYLALRPIMNQHINNAYAQLQNANEQRAGVEIISVLKLNEPVRYRFNPKTGAHIGALLAWDSPAEISLKAYTISGQLLHEELVCRPPHKINLMPSVEEVVFELNLTSSKQSEIPCVFVMTNLKGSHSASTQMASPGVAPITYNESRTDPVIATYILIAHTPSLKPSMPLIGTTVQGWISAQNASTDPVRAHLSLTSLGSVSDVQRAQPLEHLKGISVPRVTNYQLDEVLRSLYQQIAFHHQQKHHQVKIIFIAADQPDYADDSTIKKLKILSETGKLTLHWLSEDGDASAPAILADHVRKLEDFASMIVSHEVV